MPLFFGPVTLDGGALGEGLEMGAGGSRRD